MAEIKVFSDPSVPANPIYWVDAFGVNTSFQDDVAGPGVTIAYAFKETGNSPHGGAAHVLSAAEKNQIRDALQKIAAQANVTFVETVLASAEVVFAGGPANGGGGAAGVTYFGGGPVQVWAYSDTPGNNSYIYKHELLHALRLDHSTAIFGNNTNPIPADEADGTTLFGNWFPGFQNDYQLFDIAALQYLYGPPPGQRAGNDTYTLNPGVFDPASPQIQWPLLWDGGGFDTLDYSAFAIAVNISLTPGVLSRIGGAAGGILDAGVFSINYRTVIEAVKGGSNNDRLSGNSAVNALTGGGGADTLDGRGSADTMNGGADSDIYVVDHAGDVVAEAAGGGVADLVRAAVNYTLAAGAQIERLETTNVAGTTAIRFNGNAFAQRIVGNAAVNVLDGRGGADTLEGRGGNDIYIVDNVSDKAIETASAGTDQVNSAVSFTLGANVENLTLTGTAAISSAGNTLANIIIGNGANNTLSGGAGVDSLRGGLGNDTYIVDNVSDQVIETVGAGTDRIISSVNEVLALNVENLTLSGTSVINGTGNTLNNVIIGNAANNILAGSSGIDSLNGSTGNDVLIGGGHRDIMTGGAGLDDFDFNVVAEMGKSATTRDVITDFTHLSDDIDLSTIDANGALAGHTFSFLATKGAAFTGAAGQLRWFQSGATTIVEGTVNADKVADFQIQLTGLKTLTAADFVL